MSRPFPTLQRGRGLETELIIPAAFVMNPPCNPKAAELGTRTRAGRVGTPATVPRTPVPLHLSICVLCRVLCTTPVNECFPALRELASGCQSPGAPCGNLIDSHLSGLVAARDLRSVSEVRAAFWCWPLALWGLALILGSWCPGDAGSTPGCCAVRRGVRWCVGETQ